MPAAADLDPDPLLLEEATLGEVTLQSEIPGDHPKKQAIDALVREAFARLSGSWHVAIRRAHAGAEWWGFVDVRGPKLFHHVVLVNSPEEIRARLREVCPATSPLGREGP